MSQTYHPETYWDQVAQNISARNDMKLIAGDDEPYYRYKRKKFLELFDTLNFSQKTVLEFGSGPGGNLAHLRSKSCKSITGVDISGEMITLSKIILADKNIETIKIDSGKLPFADDKFDIVFTSTVLQHNTNEEELQQIVEEICRVSSEEIFLFERIEKIIKGHESNLGRPIKFYSQLMHKNGFKLIQIQSLKIQASYYICGFIRKAFNSSARKEGERLSKSSIILQKMVLPLTTILDKIIPSKRDVTLLRFEKEN
jgi:SAM-dependent methyltransferase